MFRCLKLHCSLIIAMVICFLFMGGPPAAFGRNPLTGTSQTFITYRYVDPMTGMEAFRLLIPKGWRAEGSIRWSTTPALPVKSRFRFYNPNGSEEFNLFPAHTYFWTNNRMTLSTKPPGSQMFGSVVAQPVSLNTAFTHVVIPGAKRNTKGMIILAQKEVPELAQLAKGMPVSGVRSEAKAGKMRIGYQEKGKQVEEELYAAVSQFIVNMPASRFSGASFINYWYIDDVFSFKAEKGKLDANARLFQTMIYSIKLNRDWYAKVANVKEMLAQQKMKQIKAVGRIGDMVARAGSKLREDQMRDWENRQKRYDRVAQNQSDTIRGVDRYYDQRSGREVELPVGGHAWGNNLGEYFVAESPSANPNEGSNQHWERLSPVR